MPTTRRTDQDATSNLRDMDAMAAVLESKHGAFAAEVAEFFSIWYDDRGDVSRSYAWAEVADKVRHRERERLDDADLY